MTQIQLRNKVKSMLKDDKVNMIKLIDKAIHSGCLNISEAENNFELPKQLLYAIYKEMTYQRKPLTKEGIDNAENIGRFI